MSEVSKTFKQMENKIISLNVHYGSILSQCTTLKKALMYRNALISTRFALLDLLNMFRYNRQNDNFHNPNFYKSINKQLLDVDIFLKEVEERIDQFSDKHLR